jgi:hypothetical protein
LFRAEIDFNTDYTETEFYLDFDLHFSDLSNIGGPENWKENVNNL